MAVEKRNRRFFDYPDYRNVRDLMVATCKRFSENTAFIIKEKGDESINYINIKFDRLLQDIYNFGQGLFNLGLKGKRIAVVSKNRYEWVITYFATLFGGGVIVPLDKGLPADELENCILRSEADAIVFDNAQLDLIERVKENGKSQLRNYICMEKNDKYEDIYQLIEKGKKLREQGLNDIEDVKIDENALCELTFTSGTSAESKIVMLSQRNIAFDVDRLNLVEDFRATDVNLAFLPYHHALGSTSIPFILSYGAATAFPDGLRYIQQNMKEYGVSVFIGVPLLIEAMYKKVYKEIQKKKMEKQVYALRKITNICPKLKRKVFKSVIDGLGGKLRLIISGAAALDQEVWEGFNEMGIIIRQGYGLSECAPVVSGENVKYERKNSIGLPLPDIEVAVFDKNEQGIGELAVKGENVMLGYYKNDEANKEAFRDGYFMTGDIGYVDRDGFVFITGRKKSVIVLKNGKNIYPEEIEALINKIPLVKESMVYGAPKDDDVLLSVKVQIDKDYVAENLRDMAEEEIKKMIWDNIKEINRTMPTYKYVKNMITTYDDFEKTTTQKIKRYIEIQKILEAEKE